MHQDPIATFQLAQQRHHGDLRSAELRRSVRSAWGRSAGRHRRTWFVRFTGRAPTSHPVDGGPIGELRHAC